MKRRIRGASVLMPPASDNWLQRDNSEEIERKNAEAQSHPDVGKRARVTKKGDDLYLKVYPITKVDQGVYYLDLGSGSTATYKRDDLFISDRSRRSDKVESCDDAIVEVVEAAEEIEPKYWLGGYTDIRGTYKRIIYRLDGDADEASEYLEEIIPEPYVECKFRGSCPKYSRDQLVERGVPVIEAAEEVKTDDEDILPQSEQEFTSERTSINSTKLPAVYKMIHIEPNKVYLDYGGGKFDNASEYAAEQGATLHVYDPYNRSAEHNREVVKAIRQNGGADFAICSNVLNVIKEANVRKEVLENIKRLLKSSGRLYLTVYEGRGDSAEGETKSGYQLNRPTAGYLDEVREVFPDAVRKGKLITATPSGQPVESATEVVSDEQKELIQKVTDKVLEVMQGPHFGFPEEDAKEYSRVEGYMKDGAFVVEVRAELSYEAMTELADELNPIVQATDRDAYFDMEEPGIMTAYLYQDAITSATYNMYNFPERSLDPPEPKYELQDSEEVIEFQFNTVVNIDKDGNWEYPEESLNDFNGEGKDGAWEGEEYPKQIRDRNGFIEDFDSVVMPHMPMKEGKYRIKGTAFMHYWISGWDEEHEDDGLDFQEASEIMFIDRDSYIDNFEAVEVIEATTEIISNNQGLVTKVVTPLVKMYNLTEYTNGFATIDKDRGRDSASYHWAFYDKAADKWFIKKGVKVVDAIPVSEMNDPGDPGEIALRLDEMNKGIRPVNFGSSNKQIYNEDLTHGYQLKSYSDGTQSIDKSRPYDDAEYHWAKYFSQKNAWGIVFKGKVIHWMKADAIKDLSAVSDMLYKYNKPIEPRMLHN